MTEIHKRYRLTSNEEPTDEMLQALMEDVAQAARESSAKAEAEKKRRLAKKRIFLVAIVIILTYVVFRTLITIYKYKQAEKAYSDLASLVTSTSTENMSSDSEQSDEIGINQENSPLHVDFDTLRAKSTDYVAWIFSPDTIINYPIAYTDNNFYYTR